MKKIASFCRKNKRTLKAIGAFLILCVVVIALVATYYFIQNSINTSGLIFEWDEATDTYRVVGYDGDSDTVVITGEYEGKKVSEIAENAFGDSSVVSVTINGVETIRQRAFVGCLSLKRVSMKGVRTIERYAFANDSALLRIVLPDSVETVGVHAFQQCTAATVLELSNSMTSIPAYCFAGCSALTEVELPDSILVVEKHAFEQCYNVVDWDLGKNLKEIGEYAFASSRAYLSKTEKLTLPESLESIGDGAFYYMAHLEKITIPSKITEIRPYTFSDCTALTRVVLPAGCTSFGESCFFNDTSLQLINLPSQITFLGGRAFVNNPWLENYVQENGMILVSNCLLGYRGEEKNLVLPESGYEFVAQMVIGHQEYERVVIPSGSCRTISARAFAVCSSLKEVVIEEGVEYIQDNVFFYNTALEKIYLPSSLKKIDADFLLQSRHEDGSLPTIYYAGTRSEWKNLEINDKNDELLTAKIVFNAEIPAS